MKIALVYNGITHDMLLQGPLDRTAEFDSPYTIATLCEAIAVYGHEVMLVEAAMLEMLGLPYTGSGPLSLALCLHKGKTKEVLSWYGIPTPAFQVLTHPYEPLSEALTFPLIVKLLHEGSSMGLSYNSVVETLPALVERVTHLMHTYAQPVLVEQFIDGREFTLPILGNAPPRTLPVIEVQFKGPRNITLFQPDDDVIRMLARIRGQRLVTPLELRLSADQERALVHTEDGGILEIPVAFLIPPVGFRAQRGRRGWIIRRLFGPSSILPANSMISKNEKGALV